MSAKIKNIIIFAIVAIVLILIYIFFIRKTNDVPSLTSGVDVTSPTVNTLNQNSLITANFLSVLLNVKNIKLDDTIFSDIAFTNLHDSSIILIPDATEGRPNPFAQFGSDATVAIPAPPSVVPDTNTQVSPLVLPTTPAPPATSLPTTSGQTGVTQPSL